MDARYPPNQVTPPGASTSRAMVEETLATRHQQIVNGIAILLRKPGAPVHRHELIAKAEEVLGEVAQRALARADRFDPERPTAVAWIMGVAVHVLQERRRSAARDQRRCVSQAAVGEDVWQAILARLYTPPPAAADKRADEVQQALAALPADQQDLLRLRYYRGVDGPELAQILGISHAAARARLCRALQALRIQLALIQRSTGDV